MMNMFKRLVKEEEGQGMAEYGLILALVAIAAIAGFTALGTGISAKMNAVNSSLSTTTT